MHGKEALVLDQSFRKQPIRRKTYSKMTGGTPEVRSDKSLTLMTFNIQHSTNGPMDQWTNGPMD